MPKKPSVSAIRDETAGKLGIKRAQIYRMATKLAQQAQVDTEMGIYLLAVQAGVNLSKHLSKDRVDDVRALYFQINRGTGSPPDRVIKRKPATKKVTVTVGKVLTTLDPILSTKVVQQAKMMAEQVYPLLYVFENSVREVILRIMQSAYKSTWWDTRVPREIRDEVQNRKASEQRNPWHGIRGAHPIYYTDLEHLGRIVQNNWQHFKSVFPKPEWLTQRLEEISHSRNPVAHMNPLANSDIQRVRTYCNDWQKQIAANRSSIPSP